MSLALQSFGARTSAKVDVLVQKLCETGPDWLYEIADAAITTNPFCEQSGEWDSFMSGVEFGQSIRGKVVYQAQVDQEVFFFIGTLVEIQAKLKEALADVEDSDDS